MFTLKLTLISTEIAMNEGVPEFVILNYISFVSFVIISKFVSGIVFLFQGPYNVGHVCG